MHFNVITLFPEFFTSSLHYSLLGKAIKNEVITCNVVPLRDFGIGRHKKTDDTPYGGGSGMVLMIEPIDSALASLPQPGHRILLSPSGKRYDQRKAEELRARDNITLVCGHYEGFDERIVQHFCDEVISIGDFVLSGGEVAALTIIESVARLLPGFMGNPESIVSESFSDGQQLEYPQYTRPEVYKNWAVPPVLLSGNHAEIRKWRKQQSETKTKAVLSAEKPGAEYEKPDSGT